MNELKEIKLKNMIYEVRGKQVMLDSDLAKLYQVKTKVLNQVVKRNINRFPLEFCFQLDKKEWDALRSQIVTLKNSRGEHTKYMPFVFTEYGITMLAGVLKSDVAISINIRIVETFIRLRKYASSTLIEQKYINNQVMKNTEDIKIVDKETGKEVGYNEPGEMWVSGPTVMLGYYKNEEETNKAFKIFEDGKKYYNTRDILKMDEQGLLYYVGRTRGIILTQDEFNIPAKIFPSKVENTINTHEEVKESCVIGVKHPDRIHIAKAYIKLKKGYHLGEKEKKEIEKLCKENLSHYEVPYDFEQVENDFPRTSIGKIDATLLENENAYNFYPELKKDKQKLKVLK